MATLHLVRQLRFTRSEFMRCLEGLGEDDALKRLPPMNCISWMVGHLANQEQYFWLWVAQGKGLYPELYRLVGYGQPATQPPYGEMRKVWQEITAAADEYLDTLTPERLDTFFHEEGRPLRENIGTLLQRNIFHYWFHTGEAFAVRQLLGHAPLPEFVGDMSAVIYSSKASEI